MENLFAWTYDHSEATDPLLFARIASKEKLQLPVSLWWWLDWLREAHVLDDEALLST